MRSALGLATVVVPCCTALLHGWIHAHRPRERTHLWLALAALGVAGIAGSARAAADVGTVADARLWQNAQMASGAVLGIGFVHWLRAFLGGTRSRFDRSMLALAAVVAAGLATDSLFSTERTLPRGSAAPAAALTPLGILVVAWFGAIAGYVGFALGRAARARRAARAPFVAYCLFGATFAHDIGVGVGFSVGPQLLFYGYLAMLVGLSAELIRGFVRSMNEAEALARDLHAQVEERSATLRRKESQLVHGERLAALGILAAGVAHEINDPLAFVSSNLNRVEELWGDPGARDDVREILDECHEGLARLRATIAELLRLARRTESVAVPVDLAEVVRSVLPLVRTEARYRARWVESLRAVPLILGEPGLLAQVALQLLLHAIRSIPEGEPGIHCISVATRVEGRGICLAVRDTGTPIPEADLPLLFDPFSPLAADGPASRLGLAVTHQIVKSHGGGIDVASDTSGTEVRVWLPVGHAQRRAAADPGEAVEPRLLAAPTAASRPDSS